MHPDQVRTILERSADDLGKPGNDDFYGHGRVNAYNAVSRMVAGNQSAAQGSAASAGSLVDLAAAAPAPGTGGLTWTAVGVDPFGPAGVRATDLPRDLIGFAPAWTPSSLPKTSITSR
jgi:hypothetical protein